MQSYEEEDTYCPSEYGEALSPHAYEEEDTCMSYEEEDTYCLSVYGEALSPHAYICILHIYVIHTHTQTHTMFMRVCICTHKQTIVRILRRRIHACHMKRRILTDTQTDDSEDLEAPSSRYT